MPLPYSRAGGEHWGLCGTVDRMCLQARAAKRRWRGLAGGEAAAACHPWWIYCARLPLVILPTEFPDEQTYPRSQTWWRWFQLRWVYGDSGRCARQFGLWSCAKLRVTAAAFNANMGKRRPRCGSCVARVWRSTCGACHRRFLA